MGTDQVADMVSGMRARSFIDHAIARQCIARWQLGGESALRTAQRYVTNGVAPVGRNRLRHPVSARHEYAGEFDCRRSLRSRPARPPAAWS